MENFRVKPQVKEKKIDMLGTHITIKVYGPCKDSLLDSCEDLIKKYNLVFSMYDPKSQLYKLNKRKISQIDRDLFDLIKVGLENTGPDSNLNILMGPLVKEWNIGFDSARLVDQDRIYELLEFTKKDQVLVDEENKTISFRSDQVQIDLGALAKGFIADRLVDHLKDSGAVAGLVNLGGNIKTFGLASHHDDWNFHIGLQDPKESRGNHLLHLAINDRSIVTSGIYERKFEEDGKTYHHILDPNTGYPIDSYMASISVISKSSLDGEIWTSRLFGKDFEYIKQIADKNPKIDIIVVDKNNEVFYTPGVERFILRKEN